jgi:hypothetical protein
MLHYFWKIFHWEIINIRMKNEKEKREKQMETVMPMNGFMELTEDDLMVVDGGVNWDRVYAGFVTYAGATLAIAAMSEPIGWVAAGAYLGICAASGAYMEYGFATD